MLTDRVRVGAYAFEYKKASGGEGLDKDRKKRGEWANPKLEGTECGGKLKLMNDMAATEDTILVKKLKIWLHYQKKEDLNRKFPGGGQEGKFRRPKNKKRGTWISNVRKGPGHG